MSQESNNKHNSNKGSPLQVAIETLDLLTQSNDNESKDPNNGIRHFSISQGKLVPESSSSFQAIVNFIKPLFLPDAHKKQQEELRKAQLEISEAVNAVKRYYELIPKLKEEGTEEERNWARYAIDVIDRYNSMFQTDSETTPSLLSRVSNYFNERHGLIVPIRKIEHKYSHSVICTLQRTINDLSIIFSAPNTTQAKPIPFSNSPTHKKQIQSILDAYHFKATQRVHEKYAKNLLLSEVRELIKKTRVEIEDNPNSEDITIQQFLQLRPGYTICVDASFKKGKLLSIPILDSIKTEVHSCSEFPLSSDHTAFAFSAFLTKPNPLNLEDTPNYSEIEKQKEQLAQRLLTDPAAEKHAIQMASLKKEVFNVHKQDFIRMHKTMTESMFRCAGVEIPKIISDFYDYVQSTDSPFDILSQTNQYVMFRSIIQPASYLNHEWLEGNEALIKGNHSERTVAAKLLMEKLQDLPESVKEQKCVADYIIALNDLLAPAMTSIFLHINSEKYNCAPPMLTSFELSIMACAFQQLLAYMDEADIILDVSKEKNLEFIRQWLEIQLKKDMNSFSNFENTHENVKSLLEELQVYFNTRYYENLSTSH